MVYVLNGTNPIGKQVLRRYRSYKFFGQKENTLFRSKPSIFQFSQKAGPNSSLAILGIGIDLLG